MPRPPALQVRSAAELGKAGLPARSRFPGRTAVHFLPPVLFITSVCYPSPPQPRLERNMANDHGRMMIRQKSFGNDWIKQLDYKVRSRSWATERRTANGSRLSALSKDFGLASVSGSQCVSRCSFTIIFPTIFRLLFPSTG